MNKVTSITIASVEKYFQTKIHLTELVVAGSGGLTNDVLHGQCAAEENAQPFDRVGLWYCQTEGFVEKKDSFCLVLMSIVSVFPPFSLSLFHVIYFLMSE